MPLYDFECYFCGKLDKDAVVQMARRDEHRECRACGGPMQRMVSVPAAPIVLGFSAENGYSRPDERFKRVPGMPGMKVQVRKGRGWKD